MYTVVCGNSYCLFFQVVNPKKKMKKKKYVNSGTVSMTPAANQDWNCVIETQVFTQLTQKFGSVHKSNA